MADKRTLFPIPADTWVLVVDGETSAGLFKQTHDVSYHSMSYDSDTDIPADLPPTPANFPTVEEIFLDGHREKLADSSLAYIWIRCDSGQVGSITVTL